MPLSVIAQAATDPLAGYSLASYGVLGVLGGLLIYGVRWVIRMLIDDRNAWRSAYEKTRDTTQNQIERDNVLMKLLQEIRDASQSKERQER